MNANKAFVTSFLVAIGLITWNEIKVFKEVPKPERYVGVGVVYGLLGIVASIGDYATAAVFGWAMVVALLYHPAGKATLGPVN